MNKNRFFLFYLIFLSFLFQACDNNDDNAIPAGEYAQGVLISNEGNFGSSNSSLSFYHRDTEEVENEVFEKVNNRPLGDVFQSLYFHNNRGFLVINNSNKVEVVDENTLTSIDVIEDGLANPRFFVASGNKGYVTNWGNFDQNFELDQSYVAVIDLNSMQVQKNIHTEAGTEDIVIANNKIFASNSFTNTLSIINLNTEEVELNLVLSSAPGAIAGDRDGNLWIICSGDYEAANGKIFVINVNDNSIVKEIDLGLNPSAKLAVNQQGDAFYYFSGRSIYQIAINAVSAPEAPLITENALVGSFYGLGLDPQTNILYASDNVGFTGNGKVFRYQVNGTLIDNFSAGIGPNGFWFK
ncbi:hypothetical protein BH23BAC1_BH23BAC1_19160 [soil metagenome]